MNERVPLALLVPLRLLCGVILVLEGWSKFKGDWLHGAPLLTTLDAWTSAHKTYEFFVPVVATAHAHPKIFGALITAGELVVGAALVLGLATRLAAFLGATMVFSFAFGGGQGLVPPGNAILLGAILLLFVFAPPGRLLGLDHAFRSHLPRWMA
jgi:uncharacterized membrane protein YphA (DoxX/SURF4 family)